ncbi:Prolyl tripeptidyl peptidase precursor [compost metagenome]
MKKYLLLLSFVSGVLSLSAQNKQFSMNDAVLGLRSNLAVENLSQLSWLPNEDAYVFTKNNQVFKTAVPSMKETPWISLSSFNQLVFGKDSLRTIPAIHWDNEVPYFQLKNDLYFLGNASNNLLVERPFSIDRAAENLKVSGRMVAYTVGNNLQLVDAQQNKHIITNDAETAHIKNGQSVHRNEFGIDGGIFISPKQNFVAFYRMDESMVNDYPVINWTVTPAKNENIKYPMSGGKSHEVTIGVYNMATRKTVFLKTGTPKDQYLTAVTWSPDEQHIYVAVLNRAQNHMWLNQYDARTGDFVKTLFEEKNDKYVEPQHPLAFIPGKNNEFLWWSERDGFAHLYRYNTSGKLLNAVTSGSWVVNELIGFTKSNEVIITSTKESAKEKHAYAVNLSTGTMKRLDQGKGVHTVDLSQSGSYLIDRYSNATTPRNINVVQNNGKLVKNILTAKDPLVSYERPKVQEVTLMADDGTPLFGKLIYPTNFDPAKKYPTIVYLYNGPHVQLITDNYPASGNLWYEYMAQRGYVIFTMDGRGSGNRGQKFEQATFRQLGTVEMNDQLVGVNYLKGLSFVDASRMGVHGWSFGGFMTTSLMLRHPGVFKVAVAGGPVIDWSMYEIMYTERYMDTPQENPKGYADNNLLTKVENLKGKLLMIHGAQDDVVVWQHSIKFVKACVDKNVQLDYFVYPGHPHNVGGKDRVHLMQKIADYFDDYLK